MKGSAETAEMTTQPKAAMTIASRVSSSRAVGETEAQRQAGRDGDDRRDQQRGEVVARRR